MPHANPAATVGRTKSGAGSTRPVLESGEPYGFKTVTLSGPPS
jgi:hypothetical protein